MALADYTHESLVELNTGLSLDPAAWRDRCTAADKLHQQTEHLASLLEEAGIKAYQDTEITAISAVTGKVDQLDSFRPIRFLPAVAARERRPHLNALRYFLESNVPARRYTRYAVVTYGEPIQAHGQLREAIADLTRRISKWSHEIRQKYDIEVLYRGLEYTRKLRNDDDENYTYHLHANVLYWPHRQLRAAEWAEFLSYTKDKIKSHWRDNGKIKDVREIVKYVIKPDDLKDIEADEVKWLFEQTFKTRVSTPMNSFKDFVSELEENRQKIVFVGKQGLKLVEKARRLDHSKREDRPKSGIKPKNIILGVTLPQFRNSPWAEPVVLVQNYEPDAVGEGAVEFRVRLKMLRDDARKDWDKNGAPDPAVALAVADAWKSGAENVEPIRRPGGDLYTVHTCRVIVRSDEATRGGVGGSPPAIGQGEALPGGQGAIGPAPQAKKTDHAGLADLLVKEGFALVRPDGPSSPRIFSDQRMPAGGDFQRIRVS